MTAGRLISGEHPAPAAARLDQQGVINIEKRTLSVPSDARMRLKFTHGRADADAAGGPVAARAGEITRAPAVHLIALGYQVGHKEARTSHAHTVAGGAEMVISLLTRAATRSGA